jgi:CRP/FNR family transcriptional regulator, nitrogen oxide reductase regulator
MLRRHSWESAQYRNCLLNFSRDRGLRQSRKGLFTTDAEVIALLDVLKPRFLEGLNPPEVASIVATATNRRFLKNSVMVNQGHPADHLFLLLSGSARHFYTTQDGKKAVLLWLRPGEIFGSAALLPRPRDHVVSTEAIMNGNALVWRRATIRRIVARYPRLVENAFSIMSDNLVAYRALHITLTCHTARERLAQVLVNLAEGMGQRTPKGFELNVTNDELANAANVALFTASRLFSEWQRKGIVQKYRGKILLRSSKRLLRSGEDQRKKSGRRKA